MPSVSGTQQRFMRKAFERRAAGHPRSTDPKMSLKKLHDFTRKVPGAPERVSGYGKGPVSEGT
jgi:hypothetical protein